MNLAKSHLTFLPILLLLMLTACPFDQEDEKPKDEPKLTHEFLWYKDGDPLRVKVWYGTTVAITYYRPDGSVEKSEELVNNKAWVFKFSDSGPYSDETTYLWRDAEGVMDQLMPVFGRYELNSSKNRITFGHSRDWNWSEGEKLDDVSFDISFKEDFYLSDWLKFTHVSVAADGSKKEITFTLSA
ncbi:hypothetical protein GCM10009119_10940 [Algoriphagus jejuensis]|uniref:Lipoprotein n=1 Tax=Algoriphagus jejuensis TaxID=419934 RepID=A0ABN1MXJ4_9BACT